MKIKQRTWEEFVEELIHKRTVKRICAIAQATRWQPFLPEIKEYAKKLRKFYKKRKKR